MEKFILIGEQWPQLGIANLTDQHCQIIRAFVHTTVPHANEHKDVRGQYRAALEMALTARVSVMAELKHVGPILPEWHWPNVGLQDISYFIENPSCFSISVKHKQERLITWRHRTLVKHIFQDRLYQCSDTELANPQTILRLTLRRGVNILGIEATPSYERGYLLAFYAAILQLETECLQRHPRYEAAIAGTHGLNRTRIVVYTKTLRYLKSHVENLLRVAT